MAEAEKTPEIVPVRRLTRSDLPVFVRTVAIAFIGGAIFNALNLPLPWMLGAMMATGSVTLMRIETNMDVRLRTLMIVVLGVLLAAHGGHGGLLLAHLGLVMGGHVGLHAGVVALLLRSALGAPPDRGLAVRADD